MAKNVKSGQRKEVENMAKYKLIAFTEDYEEEILDKERIEDIDMITKNFDTPNQISEYLQSKGYLLSNNTRFKIVKTSMKDNKPVIKTRPIILSGDYRIVDILTQGEESDRPKEFLKISLYNYLQSDKFYERFSKTRTFKVLTESIPSNFKSLTTKGQITRKIYNLSQRYTQSYLNYRDLYFDIKSSKIICPTLEPTIQYEEPSIYTLISSLTRRVSRGEITRSEAIEELLKSIGPSDLRNVDLPEQLSIDSLTRRKK